MKTWNFDTHHVWTGFGSTDDTYAPHWVRHGTTSGISSIYRTYLPLPSGALSALAGADSVQKIEIRLSQHGGFAGDPYTGLIAVTSVNGSSEPQIYYADRAGTTFQSGQTKWFTLSSAQRTALAGGAYKGIAIGRTTAVTLQDFYGTSAGSSVRPQVRITYTA